MTATHREAVRNEVGGKNKAPSLGEVTSALTLAIGLGAAWLYVAGWTYVYHYFDRFGIPLLMVEIPKEYYFVYGAIVVQRFLFWELAIAVVLASAVVLWRRLGLSRDAGGLTIPLCVLALFAVFWLGHQAAVAAAHQQFIQERESDYSTYQRVQVWPKDTVKPPESPPRTSAELTNGCYRLILHNKNRLFLVRPFRSAPAADLPLLILPWDQIEQVRVLPDYTSCL
jgi:hypothetical protein